MQNEELSADSFGYSCATCDEHLRRAVGADADGNAFSHNPGGLDPLRVHIGSQRAVHCLGHVLQRKFAKCDQVAATKEVGKGFFRTIDTVDIPAAHAGLQCLRRQVGHHDLVCALHQPIRHSLANRNPGDALDSRRNALNMLHVHRGENIDVGCEHVEHILIALSVFAAFNVGMSELVDQDDLRPTRQNAVEVHLFEDDTLVFNLLPRNFFELVCKFGSARPAVGLDDSNYDIFSALMTANRLAQHVVCLAHPGSVAEKKLEGAAGLLRRNLFQPFLRALCRKVRVVASSHRDKIGFVQRDVLRSIVRYSVSTATAAVIVAVYVRWLHVNETTVAMTFLVGILVVAANWGLRHSIYLSIVSALAFNFFFLPPVMTLTIGDSRNWVALLAFLVTSIVASQLAERARREAKISRRRQREAERLYEFSQQMLVTGMSSTCSMSCRR